MKKYKSVLSLLLVLVMLCSLAVVPAFADDDNNQSGTDSDRTIGAVQVIAQAGGATVTPENPSDNSYISISTESTPPAVTIDANINTNTDDTGLIVKGSNGNSVEVKAGGVTAGNGYGVNATSFSSGSQATVQVSSVTADDDVGQDSQHYQEGVRASSSNDSSTQVVVGSYSDDGSFAGGTIKADDAGVDADSHSGGTTIVKAGDVTSDTSSGNAVSAKSGSDVSPLAKTEVTVGTVTVTNNGATAVFAQSYAGGTAEVTADSIKGSTSATAPEVGIEAWANGSYNDKASTTTITVKKDVEATATGISTETVNGGTVNVNIGGNVTSEKSNALAVTGTGTGKTDVLIEGTATTSGGRFTISLDDNVSSENTDITVWKIAGDSEESLVYGLEETIKAVIHYIVKTNAAENASFSAKKADGNALDKHHDLQTAQEDDKIYLRSDSEEYKVDEGYYVDEKGNKTLLESDDNGFYYTVKRGGGILLSAVLSKIAKPTPAPAPAPAPAPTPEKKAEPKSESAAAAPAGGGIFNLDYTNHVLTIDLTTAKVQTLLTGTLQRFQHEGIDTVVILVTGGSYTVSMADLIELIGAGPSVTMNAVGDSLELSVSGQVVTTLVMTAA